jgi:excisionase family DNA binding protein
MRAPLMTVAELAELLNTSPAAIYQKLARNQIPAEAIRRIGRSVRFDPSAISTWLNLGDGLFDGVSS